MVIDAGKMGDFWGWGKDMGCIGNLMFQRFIKELKYFALGNDKLRKTNSAYTSRENKSRSRSRLRSNTPLSSLVRTSKELNVAKGRFERTLVHADRTKKSHEERKLMRDNLVRPESPDNDLQEVRPVGISLEEIIANGNEAVRHSGEAHSSALEHLKITEQDYIEKYAGTSAARTRYYASIACSNSHYGLPPANTGVRFESMDTSRVRVAGDLSIRRPRASRG